MRPCGIVTSAEPGLVGCGFTAEDPKVGNPIASIFKSNV